LVAPFRKSSYVYAYRISSGRIALRLPLRSLHKLPADPSLLDADYQHPLDHQVQEQ
jgi:hypothetical protein